MFLVNRADRGYGEGQMTQMCEKRLAPQQIVTITQ